MCLSGCASKKEYQGLFKYQLKQWRNKCCKYDNEPQSYPKIQFSLNNPYLGIQVMSADMNNSFGLLRTFVTLDRKVTFTQRPFWEHQRNKNVKIMTWIQDIPHPRGSLFLIS